VLKVEDEPYSRPPSLYKGREDLKFNIFVQEGYLPNQSRRPRRRTASKNVNWGLLHSESLMRKYLLITDPKTVLKNTQVLYIQGRLLAF
jgi:hypothetical protein